MAVRCYDQKTRRSRCIAKLTDTNCGRRHAALCLLKDVRAQCFALHGLLLPDEKLAYLEGLALREQQQQQQKEEDEKTREEKCGQEECQARIKEREDHAAAQHVARNLVVSALNGAVQSTLNASADLPAQFELRTEQCGTQIIRDLSGIPGSEQFQTKKEAIMVLTRETLTSVYDGVAAHEKRRADAICSVMGDKEVVRRLRRSLPRQGQERVALRKCQAFVIDIQKFADIFEALKAPIALERARILHARFLCRESDARRLSLFSALDPPLTKKQRSNSSTSSSACKSSSFFHQQRERRETHTDRLLHRCW